MQHPIGSCKAHAGTGNRAGPLCGKEGNYKIVDALSTSYWRFYRVDHSDNDWHYGIFYIHHDSTYHDLC